MNTITCIAEEGQQTFYFGFNISLPTELGVYYFRYDGSNAIEPRCDRIRKFTIPIPSDKKIELPFKCHKDDVIIIVHLTCPTCHRSL